MELVQGLMAVRANREVAVRLFFSMPEANF
jgi:hypothetical protein